MAIDAYPLADFAKVRLAREAIHMQSMAEQGALVRRLVRKTQNGTVGQATTEPEDADMGDIRIGDEYRFESPPTAAAAVPTLASKLLPWLTAGALGLAAPQAMDWFARLWPSVKPTVNAPAEVDPSARYDLRLHPEP